MLNFKKCNQLGKKISFEKGFSTVSRIAFYQLLHLIEGTELGMSYFYVKVPKKIN